MFEASTTALLESDLTSGA